ncbi:MAG: hypothetical protein AAFP19_10305 [Bacteroidota bacterium]
MGIIIKKKKHYYTRFPLWLLVIVVLSLSPFIIGFTGAYFTELITGEPCHEGNCSWGAIPWLGIFFTLPLGAVILAIYLIIVVIDAINLKMGKDEDL